MQERKSLARADGIYEVHFNQDDAFHIQLEFYPRLSSET
jgi:hypothetical protein